MKKTSTVKISKTTLFNPKSYERGGITEQEVLQIKEAFDLFDYEGTGSIDPKQLKAAMNSQGFETRNQTLYQAITEYDNDGVKAITFDQFFSLLTGRATDRDSKQNMKKVFAFFDDEKTGFISAKNLRRITKQLSLAIDQQQLQQMVDKADLDNDGLVSEEQFYQIMTRKNK